MHRLAQFQHHIVGDIHQRAEAANACAAQAFLHPQGRAGCRIDIANHPTHIARAVRRRLQGHRKGRFQPGWHRIIRQQLQRTAVERRHLAGDALHAQAVATIGCQLDFDELIIQLQQRAHILPGPAVRRQRQQTIRAFRQTQFLGRTEHAVRLDTAQLGLADGEAPRQHRTDQGRRRAHAQGHIRRAADDLQRRGGAHIHGRYP